MKNLIVFFLLISWFVSYSLYSNQKEISYTEMYNSKKHELLSVSNEKESIVDKKNVEEKIVKLKNAVNLDVQFYPQSPFDKWWSIFDETCEEASALIAVNYVLDKEMTREEFRDELLWMVDWQNEVFWDYKHTDVNQTAKMMKEYLGFSDFKILDNPSLNEIKINLTNNNIIIAPFYWKGMNPNFLNWWPEYHFLVIKWYSENEFITHEVWSKHWENYNYIQEDLMDRLHDYDSSSVQNWKKRLIVLNKTF